MNIDLSKFSPEDISELRTLVENADLPVEIPQQFDSPFSTEEAPPLVESTPYAPKYLAVSGEPEDYYCGACPQPNSPSLHGSRLFSSDDLREHSRISHPHHEYFGRWPQEIKVKALKSAQEIHLEFVFSQLPASMQRSMADALGFSS